MRQLYDENQTLQAECERAEAMLKAQLAINRELHLEVEQLEKNKSQDRKELDAKVLALEGDVARQVNKIRVLEAERKQRLYDVRKGRKGRSGVGGGVGLAALAEEGDDATVAESEGGDTLMEELGDEEFGPDENLVEVWVREAALSVETWDREAPTFAIVDFFNFESEATPVLEGRMPQYDSRPRTASSWTTSSSSSSPRRARGRALQGAGRRLRALARCRCTSSCSRGRP